MNYVYQSIFSYGAGALFNLQESKALKRRYILENPVKLFVHTDCGILQVETKEGFVFDGRSGPRILDCYVPNLGSLDERTAWFMHDCLGYAQSLNFEDTNKILQYFLRDICGYNSLKAKIINKAVSLSKSWYGEPKEGDWCRCNLGKVKTKMEWR